MKNILLTTLLIFTVAACYCQDIDGAHFPAEPALLPHPEIAKGEVKEYHFSQSKIFPGTTRSYWMYVPAGYKPDKPACLYVCLDGIQFHAPDVFDYLIAKGQMPMTIGIFINSGTLMQNENEVVRYNRSHEFDSMNSDFTDFFLNELLPDAEKQQTADGRTINLSKDANDHMIAGLSTGGIGAFTAAWQRPDYFSRVFTTVGTYVDMRGGDQYPGLIRKTEPKPIRIFLEDGSKDTWNPIFGSWFTANLNMEAALSFAGYEVGHFWGSHEHTPQSATPIFPDAMRWLWKGWPMKVTAGISNNGMLKTILAGQQTWQEVSAYHGQAAHITGGVDGSLVIQGIDGELFAINSSDKVTMLAHKTKPGAIGTGPDGKIYLANGRNLTTYGTNGQLKTLANHVAANALTVTPQGDIYCAGNNSITLIKAGGSRQTVDTGLQFAAALTLYPDKRMLLAAENNTNWVYSYIIQPDGSLKFKQRWYWLHQTDQDGYSKTPALAMDNMGYLYAATNMGIQVCDQNGRVRAILSIPGGGISDLCFAGTDFNTLYVICKGKIYKRRLNVNGVPTWAKAVYPKSMGGT